MRDGVPGMVGESALVVKTIRGKHEPGLVRLRGEEWLAIPLDPNAVIEQGSDVIVADIDRGTLVVFFAAGA
jgi:membrane protein implicated in regulation of membrane protease activity